VISIGTFTLIQNQINKTATFRPDSDIVGCINWHEDVYRNITTITVRPDGNNTIQLDPFPGAGESNYEDVDEVIADDDTTYVENTDAITDHKDTYTFTIPDADKINTVPIEIRVYYKVRRNGLVDGGNVQAWYGLRTTGGDHVSGTNLNAESWTTLDKIFYTNPDTGNPWTWAELEASFFLIEFITNASDSVRCTQAYAEITYRETSFHYVKVDEEICDEDNSYVYWNEASTVSELYGLPNHTTETGTIKLVQIYAEAKSNEYPPHIDTDFKIICSPTSECSIAYKSSNIDLINQYSKYQHVWTENPATSAAWTWDNIDALAIGVETYVHEVTVDIEKTIRPNQPGDHTGLEGTWQDVDEETPDGLTSYIWDAGQCGCTGNKYSIFLANVGSILGLPATINNVTISLVVKKHGDCDGGTPGDQDAGCETCKEVIKTHGVEYRNPTSHSTEYTWKTYSYSWNKNPNTSANWTWLEIGNLQIGAEMQGMNICTQVYAIVSYANTIYPDVRLTQCYAKVSYDAEVTCTLNKPIQISTNHARNIKMLNFWNGSREVYDLNRSGKSMVLTGRETGSTACDTIICVRNMARDGNIITISELNPNYFNGDYRIKSFGWNKISEKPEHYKWILDLEAAD